MLLSYNIIKIVFYYFKIISLRGQIAEHRAKLHAHGDKMAGMKQHKTHLENQIRTTQVSITQS